MVSSEELGHQLVESVEGHVAEVDVELVDRDKEWSPYLSLDDAYKLDDIRNALRRSDVKSAARLAHIFTLTPIAI